MKKLTLAIGIYAVICLLLHSCGAGNTLITSYKTECDSLFNTDKYSEAYAKHIELANLLTAKKQPVDSVLCRRIAILANKTNNHENTILYGSKFSSDGDNDLLCALASSYETLNQQHKAIAIIEHNTELFYSVNGKSATIDKLALYYNSTDATRLKDLYPQIESVVVRAECFPNYFNIVKDSLSEKELSQLCKVALKDNKDQIVALDYLGITLYESAQTQYKKAMSNYEKKKTATEYAYLKRDLKRISNVYVESKNYLEQLRKLDPDNKKYISCLVNIYLRLDQDSKANALKKLL